MQTKLRFSVLLFDKMSAGIYSSGDDMFSVIELKAVRLVRPNTSFTLSMGTKSHMMFPFKKTSQISRDEQMVLYE